MTESNKHADTVSFCYKGLCWKRKKRSAIIKHESLLTSPVRENLLRNVTFPYKRNLLHQRYIPENCADRAQDSLNNLLCNVENEMFEFKGKPKEGPNDSINDNSPISPTLTSNRYGILKHTNLGIEIDIEKRRHYYFHQKILRYELLGEDTREKPSEDAEIYTTPIKKSPGKKLLQYSIDSKSSYFEGLFEKSPKISLRSATKDFIFSPRKKLFIPDTSSAKVLDAPGIVDDFYLKLIDWSNNNMIAVALDTKFYIYNFDNESVKEMFDYSKSKESITSVAWSKLDPTKVLIGTAKGRVQYWDTQTEKCILQRMAHRDRIGTIDWNENCFSSGSKDKQILYFDIRERISSLPVLSFTRHSHEICGLKWSPGGHMLASGGNDNKLIIWSSHSSKPIVEFQSHTAAVRALAWSPHKNGMLASGGGSADRTIKFWDTLTLALDQSVVTESQVCNLAWSVHSKRLVSTHGYNDNTLTLWEYPIMKTIIKLKGHTCRVIQMAVAPNGEDVVTGAGDETVRFWKVFPYSTFSRKEISALLKNVPTFR